MDPGPGQPDIQQPPLLGHLGRGARLPDRQDPLLDRRQQHGVELQPLGPVVGEQVHPATGALGLLGGPAAHLLQELGQAGRPRARGLRGGAGLDPLGDPEQGDQAGVALAGLLAVGLLVAAEPEALEPDRLQGVDQPAAGRPGRA
jgi:hypothetical protein